MIRKAADAARKRVSGYSSEKRAALLKHARNVMNKKAFTLIEILIVVAILAILAAMLFGQMHRRVKGATVPISPVTDPTPATQVQAATPGGRMPDVQFLFTMDGMKMYRFQDGTHTVYFVDGRNSKVSWDEVQHQGKATVVVPLESQTVK